jgi:putative phosphoribosyl transferase
MYFKDRKNAASVLIPYLEKYRNVQGVVLAIPMGGVPIAYDIAKEYNFPLELLMTKKIGYPSNPELAIGAVGLEDYTIDESYNVPPSYIKDSIKRIRKDLKERYQLFMENRKPVNVENKTVIIVDDGAATGNTLLSSIQMLRNKKVKKIIVAVPVSSKDAASKIKNAVDEFICPYIPEDFVSVGYHYNEFSHVSDEQVITLLKEIHQFETVG